MVNCLLKSLRAMVLFLELRGAISLITLKMQDIVANGHKVTLSVASVYIKITSYQVPEDQTRRNGLEEVGDFKAKQVNPGGQERDGSTLQPNQKERKGKRRKTKTKKNSIISSSRTFKEKLRGLEQ